jgi:hypothetical protein
MNKSVSDTDRTSKVTMKDWTEHRAKLTGNLPRKKEKQAKQGSWKRFMSESVSGCAAFARDLILDSGYFSWIG